MTNKRISFSQEILKLASYAGSLSFIGYTAFLQIASKIFPDVNFFGLLAPQPSDLKFFIVISLILAGIGWSISYNQKVVNKVSLFSLPKKELVLYLIISLSLGYSFSKTTSPHPLLSTPIFLILSMFLLFYLPQLGVFYSTFNFYYLKSLLYSHGKKRLTAKALSRNILIISFTYFIFALVILLVSNYLTYKNTLRRSFYITDVNPHQVIYASLVELKGFNFGWKTDDDKGYKLSSKYGEIAVKDWTDSLVSFDVPLHLKEGPVTVWLEKPKNEKSNEIFASNKISFMLLDRRELYPQKNADFFERAIKKIRRFMFLNLGIPYSITLPTRYQFN